MRSFSEAMDELLETCEAHKAPKVVSASIAALIAQNERKLFCWVGNPTVATAGRTNGHAGLYASDFLEELVLAVRALDWERVVVRIHEAVSCAYPSKQSPEIETATAEIGDITVSGEVLLSAIQSELLEHFAGSEIEGLVRLEAGLIASSVLTRLLMSLPQNEGRGSIRSR